MTEPLLEVKDLRTTFFTEEGRIDAVDGISFSVAPGEILGIVGESGCGKSVTALSILRLVPSPPGRIVGGEIRLKGRDLLKLSNEEMRQVRGNEIAMIFQEPMTSLNPVFTVGYQIGEAIALHQKLRGRDVKERVVEMLDRVGIASPAQRAKEYPHQLSGGMRQRVMIAMALSCNPSLLIADEPTTALDVTIQAQILDLLAKLRDDLGMAMILITHDFGIVAEIVERVAVMYVGRIVEESPAETIFDRPMHPYTVGLLRSMPRIGDENRGDRLEAIPGGIPSLLDHRDECRFLPRCERAVGACSEKEPQLVSKGPEHSVRCVNPLNAQENG